MPTSKTVCVAFILLATGVAQGAECPIGQAMNERDGWEWIANNAIRIADYHAVENNPSATFIGADVTAYYQAGGEYEGEYLVMVKSPKSPIAFAALKPNFDFCSDPAELDDAREDLFKVVSAKLEGIPY